MNYYLGFIIANAVNSKAPLDVVDQSEVLSCLLNRDHIYVNTNNQYHNKIKFGQEIEDHFSQALNRIVVQSSSLHVGRCTKSFDAFVR